MSTETSTQTAEDVALVTQAMKESSGTVVVLGIATLIAGLLAIFMPAVAGTSVTILVAILMVAAGIARTIFAFKAESWGKGILVFFVGVLTLLCGLFILARPGIGLEMLTLVLAAYFFADGIFECIAAFKMKPLKGWGWMLWSGICSILLGFMIAYEWPVSGFWAIGILVGIRLVFAGWSMIALGSAGRSAASEVQSAAGSAG